MLKRLTKKLKFRAGGIHPLRCRFTTASDPQVNISFVLSIKIKLKLKQRYEKATQDSPSA
ncbi:MAG TPA: hypothetical protein VIM64_15855 [Puia sp.]